MNNGKQPTYPQSENWQNDMEKHIANSEKYGKPSMIGTGLTKREYFAGLIIQSLITRENLRGGQNEYLVVARHAICCADALLEELEKTT